MTIKITLFICICKNQHLLLGYLSHLPSECKCKDPPVLHVSLLAQTSVTISVLQNFHLSHWTGSIGYQSFLHDRPWIWPWIKSISNELDIIIHVIASQLSGHCDVISNRLWRHQQKEKRASETRGRCVQIVVLSSFMDLLCHVRNKIMYVLSWRTVSAFTRYFGVYFPRKQLGKWTPK